MPMQAAGASNRPISLQPFGQWSLRAVCCVAALVDSRAIHRAPRLAFHPAKPAARPLTGPTQALGRRPALQDLLGERVTSYFAAPPTALPHIDAGKLIPLATTGLTRPSYMPNIPTVAEAGYPGFKSLNWYAFVAPGKTPAPLLDRWNQEIVKVLNDPSVKEALNKHGLTPQPTTRAELTAFMKKESTQWATIIKERKLTAD